MRIPLRAGRSGARPAPSTPPQGSGTWGDDAPAEQRGQATIAEVATAALRRVYDPELCMDIVSLGLVYDVRESPGRVEVDMTLTTPGCPASESLPAMAEAAVSEALDGEVAVGVNLVWDPPWSPALIKSQPGSVLRA